MGVPENDQFSIRSNGEIDARQTKKAGAARRQPGHAKEAFRVQEKGGVVRTTGTTPQSACLPLHSSQPTAWWVPVSWTSSIAWKSSLSSWLPCISPFRDRDAGRWLKQPFGSTSSEAEGLVKIGLVELSTLTAHENDRGIRLLEFCGLLEFLGGFLCCHVISPPYEIAPWG